MRTAKSNWRLVRDAPALRADFDATPELIREIEIDHAVVLGHPHADLALGTIELRLGLEHIEGGAEGRWHGALNVRS